MRDASSAVDQGRTIRRLKPGAHLFTTVAFYHVTTDNQFPYVVYGSQQDQRIGRRTEPDHSRSRQRARLVFRRPAEKAAGIAVEPKDSNIVMRATTNGNRWSVSTSVRAGAQHHAVAGAIVRRGNFAAKISIPMDCAVGVFADRALERSTSIAIPAEDGRRRLTWREVSPDLTGADKALQPPDP